jgi:TPR repeat protein
MFTRYLKPALLCMSLVGPVAAQTLPTEVSDALERGDFAAARVALAPLATTQENAQAQYRYGVLLLQGQGGPVAQAEGIAMLEAAAAQNHAAAALLLARIYLTGNRAGVARNPERAATLLSAAAEQDNGAAQYYLGLLYQNGQGVEKDAERALALFTSAAENGDREAQYELSKAYANGKETEADPVAALRWLRAAADNGQAEAQFFLANALNTGRGVALDKIEARQWYRRAAENGIPLAQRILGSQYLTGDDGLDPNPTEALRWLTLAAEAGDPGAMQNLAVAYGGEHGIERDDAAALEWYARASEEGLARATYALGQYYEAGRGVPVDIKQAAMFYRAALEQGDERAALRLGHLTGQGVLDAHMPPHFGVDWALVAARAGDEGAKNWLHRQADAELRAAQTAFALLLLDDPAQAEMAVPYLERSAAAGDVTAQFEIGTLYATGLGVALDYVQAHIWLNIAATSGHVKAAETRDVIGNLMTPEQVSAAQTATREFFETASQRLPKGVVSGRGDQ